VFAVLFINFTSASFVKNSPAESIKAEYAPQDFLQGWIDIKLTNENANSLLSTNFGGSIEILDLLKLNNATITCNPKDCEPKYSINSDGKSSFNFSLLNGITKLLGIKFTGNIKSISSIKFSVQSNAQLSCENQIKIDVLNDKIIEAGNSNISIDEFCGLGVYGCYEDNELTEKYVLKKTPYCQKIKFPEAPGFEIGAWIIKTAGEDKIKMTLYDDEMNKMKECEISATISAGGEEYSCQVKNPFMKEQTGYVCINSATDAGSYQIVGNSEPSKVCGFLGNYIQKETAAYQIFAKPKKFDSPGTIEINNSMSSDGNLASDIEDYIYKKYGKLDCSAGCIVPIKLISQKDQNINISNLKVEYSKESGVVSEDKFYELTEIPAKISSGFQKINLEKARFSVPSEYGEKTLRLKLGDTEILSKKITVKKVATITSVSPKKTFAGYSTKFVADIKLEKENVTKYEWFFSDGKNATTSVKSIVHTFDSTGIFELKLKITDTNSFSSYRIFNISVNSPKEIIIPEIENQLKKIENARLEIKNFSGFAKERLNFAINFNSSENKIIKLQKDYEDAEDEVDYIKIIKELTSLKIPKTISISEEAEDILFYPKAENVNLDILKKIGGGDYKIAKKQEYIDAINSWFYDNAEIKMNYNEILLNYDTLENDVIKIFDLDIKGDEIKDYYIIIKDLEGLEFKESYSEKEEEGYAYIKTKGLENIIFSATEQIDFVNLPLFVSPSLLNLNVSDASESACNYNDECEKERGESWKNCKDCNSISLIALITLLISVGIVILYFITKIAYEKIQEKRLFENKSDLENISSYIKNAEKKNIEKEKMISNLKNAGWKPEQIHYAIKKHSEKK